jgi:hypothetical protein
MEGTVSLVSEYLFTTAIYSYAYTLMHLTSEVKNLVQLVYRPWKSSLELFASAHLSYVGLLKGWFVSEI